MNSPTKPAAPTVDRSIEIIEALAPLLAHHRQRWAAHCHAQGISILGFGVLSLLEIHGAIPMGRLADELDVALPNATGIVNRLEERGLVARRDDPADRRIVLVEMTEVGGQVIRDMEASRRERMVRLMDQLDEPQQRRLLRSVKDLRSAAMRLAQSVEGDA